MFEDTTYDTQGGQKVGVGTSMMSCVKCTKLVHQHEQHPFDGAVVIDRTSLTKRERNIETDTQKDERVRKRDTHLTPCQRAIRGDNK